MRWLGKDSYRRSLIGGQSARLICGYVYANAGEGESTQDLVFGGHNLIGENGTLLAESRRFAPEVIYADLDLERLAAERRRTTTHPAACREGYRTVEFSLNTDAMEKKQEEKLLRRIDSRPFVPGDNRERNRRCEEILRFRRWD